MRKIPSSVGWREDRPAHIGNGPGPRWRKPVFESIQRYRDYYAGALLILIGLSTVYQSSRYDVGTLAEVGPGFFPMVMGVILAGCGIAIAFNQSTVADDEHDAETLGRPEWRGWYCILGGVLAFILLAHSGGLFPATFACVFISAMGDRTMKVRNAAVLALSISVFGVLLFHYALKVQLQPFAWMAR
jgi:Tripartite tricarboxylate transporter TctB family